MTLTHRYISLFTKLRRNIDGVAAIEFALIAPLMIALYVGLAEVSLLVTADRKVSHSSSVTGDLVAQFETVDSTDMEDIFGATLAVMGTSYAKSQNISIDIRSFAVDASNNKIEVGYAKMGSGFTSKFDASAVHARLLNKTSGLVVARIKYNYTSPSKEFVGTPTLSETFMLKPRKSATIPFTKGGASTMTCTLSQVSGKQKVTC